ncbi:PREDICTED: V-type proton ATPase subunit a1, partial [Prunus dulcis]
KILHAEVQDGTLELPFRKQAFDKDSLPKQREKEIADVITCFDDLLDDDVLCHPLKNDPKPSEDIWEPCGNMEKAYWCKYSKPSSYSTSWPFADGWEDGSSREVFTLDMLEERHLGASFGQQHYLEIATVTSHNLTKVEESTM